MAGTSTSCPSYRGVRLLEVSVKRELTVVVVFLEAVSENGNLEDLFKQFASLMPLRGYKLLQVTFICL